MNNVVPLFKPSYGPREEELVCQALRSGWTGLGPLTQEFEEKFAKRLGVKYALMTNSCTSALELALLAHGIGPGHRVAVPTMTFVATAHAVRNVGAEVVLRDVDENDLCLQWRNEQHEDMDCIIPVLFAGQPYQAPLWEEAECLLIYDCAHAVGSSFDARGKTCCWSFHAVKNLACGEGGMLTTDDDAIAEKVRRMRWLGVSKSTYERSGLPANLLMGPGDDEDSRLNVKHRQIYSWEYGVTYPGRKAHGNDLAAAVGLAQLERLDEMQARRECLWLRYQAYLTECGFIAWLVGHSSLLAMLGHPRADELMGHLALKGIQSGRHYKPLHLTEAYGEPHYPYPIFPVANKVWRELITLPLFPEMSVEQQDRVIEAVRSFK